MVVASRPVFGDADESPARISAKALGFAVVLLLGYAVRYLVLLARRRRKLDDTAPDSLRAPPARAADTSAAPSRAAPIVFAGTGSAIFAFEFHEDGRMVRIGAPVPAGGSPSWLIPDPTYRRLYAVDEASTGGGCASFAIRRDGTPNPLHFLNKVKDPLSPSGPTHCCVDGTGKWLLASNYGHGSCVVYEITEMGTLGRVADTRSFGSELRPSHAHCGAFSPDNAHAFICDLGLDGIHQFEFDERTGRLRSNRHEPFVHSSPGSGPRHIAFHPRGTAAYTINEHDSTVDTFAYLGRDSGRLRRQQTLPTLPAHFEGQSYCAEIKVSADGRHVYGSNRAVEPARSSVVCFAVLDSPGAPQDTALQQVGWVGESISWPRGMSLSPSGRHVIVANQRGRYGDTIAVFDRDERTGMLSLSHSGEEENVFPCPDPQSIDWVPANDVPYTLLA